MTSWSTRRYEATDDSKITDLLKLSFPSFKNPEYWKWVHKENPLGFHGEEGDIWVAENERGEMVGYRAVQRTANWYFGRVSIGGQVIQLATHPDYRKQGVYEKLARCALEDAKKNNLNLVFGYPNEQSYPAASKIEVAMNIDFVDVPLPGDMYLVFNPNEFLDSRHLAPASKLLSSLNLRRFGRRKFEKSPARSKFELVETITNDIGSVWDSIKQEFDFGIERQFGYLKWRYSLNWGNYKLVCAKSGGVPLGYVAYRILKNRSYSICDLVSKFKNKTVYEALLDEVSSRAKEEDAPFVSISRSSVPEEKDSQNACGYHEIESIANILSPERRSRLLISPTNQNDMGRLQNAKLYYSKGDRDVG